MHGSQPPLALAYHGVADVRASADPYSLFTSPRALRRHILLLRRWGYRFVTCREWADLVREGRGDGHVALTFDDGLADNHSNLLPLLQAERVPATVFVATAYIGGRHPDAPGAPMLDNGAIVHLADSGVEIGAHSHSHSDLTTLSFDAACADLRQSREILEELLDRPVRVAAYPFGAATDETSRACRAAGFDAAVRTGGEGSYDDPWNLPRQDMNGYSGIFGLWLKARGHYEPLMRHSVGRATRSATRRAKLLVR